MKKNKKRNRIYLLILLLLGITVGFALLSTTLKINGNASITKNNWSVYWDEDSIAVTQGSKGDTIPDVVNGEDGSINTKVNWNVNLELPGDFYEFTIDAVNAGTLDAMITGITPTLPQDLPSYVSYSVTYADGVAPAQYHLLPKGTKSGSTITPTIEKYKVRIEFLNTITPEQMDAIPEEGLSLDFGYEVQYGQADDDAIPRTIKQWTLPTGKTGNTLEVGDEICSAIPGITDQCFNFVRYDGDNIVMLAKYNLNVGPHPYGEETFMQNSNVDGYEYGDVEFSTEQYWINTSQSGEYTLVLKYSENDTIYLDTNPSSYRFKNRSDDSYAYPNVYDNTYVSPRGDSLYGDENYSIAYYVEEYKNILEDNPYNVSIEAARLLYFNELALAGIEEGQDGKYPTTGPKGFIPNTNYWLGSAQDLEYMKVATTSGWISGYAFGTSEVGVRPVLIIAKSNL